MPYDDDLSELGSHDLLLVDVSQRLQLTKTEHEANRSRYNALADFIDGRGSVLEDKVVDVFTSGSNAIDAAIRGLIKRDAPDVDAVIVLDLPSRTPPETVLGLVKSAITRGGDDRNTYRDCKVEQNSRCVTVIYADGSKVDLMPVVLLSDDDFAPVMQLFHYENDASPPRSYVKLVSPIGFKNAVAEALMGESNSALFEAVARARRTSTSLLVEKADVAQFPEQTDFIDKSPRIVVLQLLKRFRDIQFRQSSRAGRRKPPSVVLAALAIEAPFGQNSSLTEELIHVAGYIRRSLIHAGSTPIEVRNPGYDPDIFTDRWPQPGTTDQQWLQSDLGHLINELQRLKSAQSVERKAQILSGLFGETVAAEAMSMQSARLEKARKAQRLNITRSGSAVFAPSISRATTSSSERFGGKADETD